MTLESNVVLDTRVTLPKVAPLGAKALSDEVRLVTLLASMDRCTLTAEAMLSVRMPSSMMTEPAVTLCTTTSWTAGS